MELFKIPYLNPLRFHNETSGKFAFETIPAHEEQVLYIQKFHVSDFIAFQVLFVKTLIASASYRIIRQDGIVIHEFTPAVSGSYGANYDVWGAKASDNIISYLEEGQIYYIQMTINPVASVPMSYISDPFTLISNAENTIRLEYTHDANRFDVAFYPDANDLTNHPTFILRLEGGLQSDGYSPESKDVFYIDQTHDTVLLDSIPFVTYKYTFGGSAGIPNWMAGKINRIFSLADVKLDGRNYVKSDGAKIEATREKGYPLAAWQLELIEPQTSDSLSTLPSITEPPELIAPGSITITPSFTVDGEYEYKLFTLDIVGDNGYSVSGLNFVVQNGAILIENVPDGNYSISVREESGYSVESITPDTFTISSTNRSQAIAIKLYRSCDIIINKIVTDHPEDETYFHVTITGQSAEPTIVEGDVKQGEPVRFKGLPPDDYVITEDTQTGYVALTPISVSVLGGVSMVVDVVNEVEPEKILGLTFDNIANVPVANANSVSDWNTYFNFALHGGTPFDSVDIVGNTVRLSGGDMVHFAISSTHLTQISGLENFTGLVVVVISDCTNLTTTPDISGLPLLGTFFSSGCVGLTETPSFAGLTSIYGIDMAGCTGLTTPPILTGCNALNSLSISNCTGLDSDDVDTVLTHFGTYRAAIEVVWIENLPYTLSLINAARAANPQAYFFT